jgi:hypothetical protein
MFIDCLLVGTAVLPAVGEQRARSRRYASLGIAELL